MAVDPNVAILFDNVSRDLQSDINDPKRWVLLGSALFANGYYEKSAEAFSKALQINQDMPQAMYLMASALWKVNKQEEAIASLEGSLELIPKYDIGWRLLAEWLLERGESDKAEIAARKAFELQPSRIGTRYILVQALMDKGQYDEAIRLIEQVTFNGKAPPWIYQLAANCYRQLGEYSKAEYALERVGAPFEDWPDPMFKHIPSLIAGKAELTEFALQKFKVNGPKKAMVFLARAFKINPENTDLRVALSMAVQDAGDVQQSKQILVELIGKPNTNYWKQYAGVSIETGELEKAVEYIGKAIAIDANDPNAHEIAAEIAFKQHKISKAVEYWKDAGKLYNESEHWKKAELSLAYAVENGGDDLDTLRALVLAQIKTEHILQARLTIIKLLEKDPSDEAELELQSKKAKK